MNDKPKKRRWYQFSLRTLGLVVTACTVVAWLAHVQQRAALQRRVVESLTLRYEREPFDPPVRYDFECQGLNAPPNVPTWLVNALGVDCFAEVEEVRGSFFPESDEERGTKGLQRFSPFRKLRKLAESGDIRDDDLFVLNQHPNLNSIELHFADVKGKGFRNASFRTSRYKAVRSTMKGSRSSVNLRISNR